MGEIFIENPQGVVTTSITYNSHFDIAHIDIVKSCDLYILVWKQNLLGKTNHDQGELDESCLGNHLWMVMHIFMLPNNCNGKLNGQTCSDLLSTYAQVGLPFLFMPHKRTFSSNKVQKKQPWMRKKRMQHGRRPYFYP